MTDLDKVDLSNGLEREQPAYAPLTFLYLPLQKAEERLICVDAIDTILEDLSKILAPFHT